MVRCWRQTAFREEGLSSLTFWANATVAAAPGSQGSMWPLLSSVLPDATLPKGSRNLGPSIDSYYEFK